MSTPQPAIVALGGGHGLYATLSAARRITTNITAIVTVADDGGSSGRLRQELNIIPPGDLRMALVALASDTPTARLWATVLQHRFQSRGPLSGHPVGNLILAGLTEIFNDPIAALDELARILGVQGRILPMCPLGLDIEAEILPPQAPTTTTIRGQVAVATTSGQVQRVRLIPDNPPATPQALHAIQDADMVILGPGSWFTSVIPHLLVPELLTALCSTTAQRILILNLAAEPGETAGLSAEQHLGAFAQHAPELQLDYIVIATCQITSPCEQQLLSKQATQLGAQIIYADVAYPMSALHDPAKLATVLARVHNQTCCAS